MPEENNTQTSGILPKTEIVATIPVQEPTNQLLQSSKSPDQVPPPASQNTLDQSRTQLKIADKPKTLSPQNHRLVLIIAIACLAAVGLSIAAVLAFKSSI